MPRTQDKMDQRGPAAIRPEPDDRDAGRLGSLDRVERNAGSEEDTGRMEKVVEPVRWDEV